MYKETFPNRDNSYFLIEKIREKKHTGKIIYKDRGKGWRGNKREYSVFDKYI